MKRIAVLLCLGAACAQWRCLSAAVPESARGFTEDALSSPDAIRHPGLFWKWDGKLTESRLAAEMDDMAAHAAITPCIHPYPRAFWPGGTSKESWQDPDYMTPGHLDLLEKMVRREIGRAHV